MHETRNMYFQMQWIVAELLLNPEEHEPIRFRYGSPHNITVEFRHPRPGKDVHGEIRHGTGLCIARGRWAPDPSVRAMFDAIAAGQLPQGSHKWDGTGTQFRDPNGKVLPKVPIPEHVLPDTYLTFAKKVRAELEDWAKRTHRIIRWRLGAWGPHEAFNPLRYLCSFNGRSWNSVYDVCVIYTSGYAGLPKLTDYHTEVSKLARAGKDEPISHTLYREAFDLRFTNPRVAIILGVAAAEIAIKQCIATLVPGSAWLLEEMQSPDIKKILRRYLPMLQKEKGSVLVVPDEIFRAVETGVEARNKLVHIGKLPEGHKAQPMLEDWRQRREWLFRIGDLLSIMDYNCGYRWALDYLWPETIKALADQLPNSES